MTIKEDIERAVRLVQTGREDLQRRRTFEDQQKRNAELAKERELEREKVRKENEIRTHQDLVRKTGVVEVWEGLVNNGVVRGRTEMIWDKDGFGLELRFNRGERGGGKYDYDYVSIKLLNNDLMLNGVSSKRMGVVEALAQSVVNPYRPEPEPDWGPYGRGGI